MALDPPRRFPDRCRISSPTAPRPPRTAQAATDRQHAAARHESKRIQRQIQQNLFQSVPVRSRQTPSSSCISSIRTRARCARGLRKSCSRATRPKIGRRHPRGGLAVKVQHVVHCGRQRSQSSLQLLYPVFSSSPRSDFRQQPGKKLQTAQRIADLVGKQRRHLGQCLPPAQHFVLALEPLRALHPSG